LDFKLHNEKEGVAQKRFISPKQRRKNRYWKKKLKETNQSLFMILKEKLSTQSKIESAKIFGIVGV